MSERFWRVRADVTYTAEWFIKADNDVVTAEEATANLREGVQFLDYENLLIEHEAGVYEVVLCDENGDEVHDAACLISVEPS